MPGKYCLSGVWERDPGFVLRQGRVSGGKHEKKKNASNSGLEFCVTHADGRYREEWVGGDECAGRFCVCVVEGCLGWCKWA